MSFLDFCFSSSWEREREWYTQFGYKGKCPQSYLSYFTTGFHWRIFLLSRATRLCSVFNTGLENLGPSCLSILLSSTRSRMAMVRPLATNPAQKLNFLTIYFRWGEGGPTSVLGSQPIIWLLSLSPSGVRRPEVTKYETWSPLRDPHSSLTVTFFWRLDTVNSNTRNSNFISLLPVGYHVTLLNQQYSVLTPIGGSIKWSYPSISNYSVLHTKTVLFQTIQFSISTPFKCQKQFYFKQFSLVNKVEWFQVFLRFPSYSIKHQLFI